MNLNLEKSIDNYLLVVFTFIAGIAGLMEGSQYAIYILSIGLLMKAILSAIDPTAKIMDNLDNIALALVSALAILVTAAGNTAIGFGFMVAGGLIKAILSAVQRGVSIEVNLDNVTLAIATFVSGILATLGYTQASFMALGFGTLMKGMFSTYFRGLVIPSTGNTPISETTTLIQTPSTLYTAEPSTTVIPKVIIEGPVLITDTVSTASTETSKP